MPPHDEALVNASAQTQDMLGGPAEIIGQHIAGVGLLVVQSISLQGPTALAMFLMGMVAARRQLFAGLAGRASLLRRTQAIGFAVGLTGGVVFALLGGDTNTWATAASVITAPFLCAAYMATLVRIMHASSGAWVGKVFAPVGRIALTNYLGQSFAGLLLFSGVGLGLAGKISPPLLMVLAVAIFALQAAISAWWLRSHRYGPAEYFLRWLTNWSRP